MRDLLAMADGEPRDNPVRDEPGPVPRRTRLGRILEEHPEARPQLGDAIGSLLKVVVVTLAIIGLLAIWHLRRRAQLIRERLGPPKDVSLPDFVSTAKAEPRSAQPDEKPPKGDPPPLPGEARA
jgi:hypothetical protein